MMHKCKMDAVAEMTRSHLQSAALLMTLENEQTCVESCRSRNTWEVMTTVCDEVTMTEDPFDCIWLSS